MSELNSSKKIVTGVFWRFGERITAQLVSLVVSIILARLLAPEDYGLVAIINIFITIVEIFVTSGLGTALIQKENATEMEFSIVFWFNIALSIILYFIVFMLTPIISSFYGIPGLTPILRVFSLKLPISAINSIQNAYLSKRMEFKKFFFATLIGTLISGVVGVIMAYMNFGVWSLVAQTLTNSFIDTIALSILINWKPEFVFSWEKAKPLVCYGWKILATDLIGTIFNQLNAFIIGKKYTSADLAYYTQGKKMPDLVKNNIGPTLCAVLFPAMTLCASKEEIISIRRKSLKMMEYVIFPLMFGMIAVADKMIIVLMTEKWSFAIPYARIACLASIVSVLGTTLIQEIKAIGRSDVTLKLELIKKPIYLIIAIIAMTIGVEAIAWTLVTCELIAFCFNVYPVWKYIGFDFKMHFMDALQPLVMAIIMAVVVYIIGLVISNDVVCLLIQVILGGIVYIGLSWLLKNESFMYLKKMIIKR